MITVVIPVYNSANYLKRCILSLESQTVKDFEVVFVDDCSQDNTVEVLNDIASKVSFHMTILENKNNRGPAYSRNRGIQCVQSDLITFCDSDDWYEPDFIEGLLGLIENTGAEIAFCGYQVVNEKGEVNKRPLNAVEGLQTDKNIFEMDVDSLCMMMVKTKLMKETLLPDLRNGEDVATVSLLLAKANGVAATGKCLYNYFRRSGSVSETPTMDVVDSIIYSFNYTKKYFPKDKKTELEFLGVKNMLYPSLISLFSFGYDKKKANCILADFERTFPNWGGNSMLKNLSWYKKTVLFFVKYRVFFVVKIIALVRSSVMK